MFLDRLFLSAAFKNAFLFTLTFYLLPIGAKAQNCQGKILHNLEIRSYGSEGDVYHYTQGEIISELKAHRASFFGKPSYYLSQGIGPLPAKEIKLLNCHPVKHASEGFFDPGYDLIPNDWEAKDKNASESQIDYQKPIPLQK